MVEHVNIPDGEIHEPKGISTAALGKVYVADGAGSGSWSYMPQGSGYYQDDSAGQVFNTTAAKLSINGLGPNTDESHLPRDIRGSGSLWNTTSDKITPIAVGDDYNLRLDLPVTTETGSPTELTIELDISGGASPSIVIVERFAGTGRTTPYTISVGFPIFVRSTFLANGGQIFLSTDSGSVTITDPAIHISRTYGEFI